jgi:Sulfotransferase family
MSKFPKAVFVLGSGRSGTTITATLLNRLPGVHLSKETGFLGLYYSRLLGLNDHNTLVALVDDVNSWLSMNKWTNKASASGYHSFCQQYGISGAQAFMYYIWQLDSPIPWDNLDFIGDNTPLYVMAIPAIQAIFPDAQFIHMVRDPRDVVSSTRQMRFGADNIIVAALEWHIYLGCWLLAERTISPERRVECRYEDLCADPSGTLTRLAEFLDRTPENVANALTMHLQQSAPKTTGFEGLAGLSHHVRLTAPLSSARVGRYRQELSAKDIMEIEKISQYGMLAYNYKPKQFYIHPLMKEDRLSLLLSFASDLMTRAWKRLRNSIK